MFREEEPPLLTRKAILEQKIGIGDTLSVIWCQKCRHTWIYVNDKVVSDNMVNPKNLMEYLMSK